MNIDMVKLGATAPAVPIGQPRLIKMAFDGIDLAPLWNVLALRAKEDPQDAAALLDLSMIAQIQDRPNDRAALQTWALEVQRLYRQPAAAAAGEPLRLLAFMTPGDFMTNMPIGFLLEGSSVTLDMVYVMPGLPLPQPLPDHDVALVADGESNENQAALQELETLPRLWPRPVVNSPRQSARLT